MTRKHSTKKNRHDVGFQDAQEILMNAPIGIFTSTVEGRYLSANPAFAKICGFDSPEELVASVTDIATQIYADPKDRLEYIRLLEEQGEVVNYESRLKRRDGNILWVSRSALAVQDNNGEITHFLVFIMDITERKQDEEKIKQINQQLQKANADKDKLFSIVAHDLKSPMIGLVGLTALFARDIKRFSGQDLSCLAPGLHHSAKTVYDLLEDLLLWARMSQGVLECVPKPTTLHKLVNAPLCLAMEAAKHKNIAIQADIPKELTVLVDQSMISTVVRNVLFNAVKFTHHCGKIIITARQEGQIAKVTVQDDGIGMEATVLSSIFSIEKAKMQLGTDGEKGTGLGLILCKELIEKHGGTIWLESKQGEGTIVSFTLPIAK